MKKISYRFAKSFQVHILMIRHVCASVMDSYHYIYAIFVQRFLRFRGGILCGHEKQLGSKQVASEFSA